MTNLNREIADEIYKALEALEAHPDLLGTIGSWGDGNDDAHTLEMLRAFNTGHRIRPIPALLSPKH